MHDIIESQLKWICGCNEFVGWLHFLWTIYTKKKSWKLFQNWNHFPIFISKANNEIDSVNENRLKCCGQQARTFLFKVCSAPLLVGILPSCPSIQSECLTDHKSPCHDPEWSLCVPDGTNCIRHRRTPPPPAFVQMGIDSCCWWYFCFVTLESTLSWMVLLDGGHRSRGLFRWWCLQ